MWIQADAKFLWLKLLLNKGTNLGEIGAKNSIDYSLAVRTIHDEKCFYLKQLEAETGTGSSN